MKFFVYLFIISNLVGCANFGKEMKAFLKGQPSPSVQTNTPKPSELNSSSNNFITFSENPNLPIDDQREYRRTTRKQFEEQYLRSDSNGSLWVMEGQDSYLFAENNVRLPGDLINVKLEGQPEKQLSTKAKVIADLTKKIEERKKAQRTPAQATVRPAATPEAAPAAAPTAAADAQKTGEEELDMGTEFDVKTVPTRIVEKLSDGNYRVKGSQNFMIGTKEYRVIVTGLVKPADVVNNAVDSTKMLDSKFDIVRAIK